MMHLAAYESAMVDETTTQQVTALSDVICSVRDNAIIVPTKPKNLNYVLSTFALCLDITRASLQPPSYRNIGFFDIRPLLTAVPTLDSPWIIHDFDQNPMVLVPGEELPLWLTMTDAATPNGYGGVLLADGLPTPYKGKYFTVHLSGTTTVVANAWSATNLTFDQGLPAGMYNVVGARAESATMLMFRFIHSSDISRPGGFGHQLASTPDLGSQRAGKRGIWFSFDYLTPPQLESISTAADTSQQVWLDLAAA